MKRYEIMSVPGYLYGIFKNCLLQCCLFDTMILSNNLTSYQLTGIITRWSSSTGSILIYSMGYPIGLTILIWNMENIMLWKGSQNAVSSFIRVKSCISCKYLKKKIKWKSFSSSDYLLYLIEYNRSMIKFIEWSSSFVAKNSIQT